MSAKKEVTQEARKIAAIKKYNKKKKTMDMLNIMESIFEGDEEYTFMVKQMKNVVQQNDDIDDLKLGTFFPAPGSNDYN